MRRIDFIGTSLISLVVLIYLFSKIGVVLSLSLLLCYASLGASLLGVVFGGIRFELERIEEED